MNPLFGKKKIVLIDGNHMLHRMLHNPRLTEMVTSDGTPSGGVFGFLKSLRATILNLQGASRIVVVFDGGNSKRREEIFPEYRVRPPIEDKIKPGKGKVSKEESEGDEDALPYYEVFGTQKKIVREWMIAMGCPVVKLKGREGDDIIYQLTRLDNGEHTCVIVSDDKDFLQLLNENVHVYRALANEYYDPDKFRKEWKMPPKKYILYKALTGDASDMVPGIKGIGNVYATEIVSAISKPKEIVGYCRDHKRKAIKAVASEENIAVFKRNLKLFDMRKEEFDDKEMKKIRKALTGDLPKVDWGTLRRIASEMELASLSSNLGQWMRPFKGSG